MDNDFWEDENQIRIEMIKNSFIYCGISNKMTGEEDELFRGWNKLNEIGLIEDDFSKEDKVDENNRIEIEDSCVSDEGSSDKEIEDEEECINHE